VRHDELGHGRRVGFDDGIKPKRAQRSGAGVEPTEPWVTRPHWF
jgi:hypothetical protein